MAAHGDDLTRARPIDFEHVLPTYEAACAMASKAIDLGFTASVRARSDSEESHEGYDVQCTKTMIPTHEIITDTERRLAGIAHVFGGYADGWGCFQVDPELS
jgi:hypothetical protein